MVEMRPASNTAAQGAAAQGVARAAGRGQAASKVAQAGDEGSARHYVDLPISIGRLRVLRGFQTLSWILAVVWIFATIHPDLGLSVQRKISYDENAVSPTTPIPVSMMQDDLSPYLEAAVGEALTAGTKGEAEWFAESLVGLGLTPTFHKFDCAAGGHGRSVYAVLRPAYTQGTEALVVAAPLPQRGKRLLGSAITLALARVASDSTWMSKSIVLLGFDADSCNSGRAASELGAGREAVEAWVDAYRRPGRLPRHGGLLREAIVLDLDDNRFEDISGGQSRGDGTLATLSVLHEGWGAVMPNLDMMATVVMQMQEVLPKLVLHVGAPASADTLSNWLVASVTGEVQHGCSTDMVAPPETARALLDRIASLPRASHRSSRLAGHDQMPWWAGWRCLISATVRMLGGAPLHGAHAPFLQRNIDAVTLVGRSSTKDHRTSAGSLLPAEGLRPASAKTSIKPLEIGRALESVCRGLANIAEEFHHARPSYIMLTPSQLVEDVWYVVPQLIMLGNLLFPILVYGYFTSSVHARGAATLLLEQMGIAIGSALAAHVFMVPYILQLHGDQAIIDSEQSSRYEHGSAVASVAAYWLAIWMLQLIVLARYDTAPGDLDECASMRLRLAVEERRRKRSGNTTKQKLSLSTVEEEAAALLEPGVREAVEDYGDSCQGRTCASFMVTRTAIYLWLFIGLSVSFVNHFVIGFAIAAVALPAHTLPLPSVWGYFPIESKRGYCTCCCGKNDEALSSPRRPARSTPFRVWTLLLFILQAVHSPPALLAIWVQVNGGSTTSASTALVQMVKVYASAPAGCTPWLPFLVLVHTPLHALGLKLQWDRRALLTAGREDTKSKVD